MQKQILKHMNAATVKKSEVKHIKQEIKFLSKKKRPVSM
jgi:hypothetical protein